MPAKDRYHDTVKRALIKDGWAIDAEQVTFITAERQIVIDIKVSREAEGIALVEVKGFQRSVVEELAISVGKLMIYRYVLGELGVHIPVWLAVPEAAYSTILTERIGLAMRRKAQIDFVVFSIEREEVVEWIRHEPS